MAGYRHSKKFTSHSQRIEIIDQYKTFGISIRQISKDMNSNYSTIFNIVHYYIERGHTNRLCNYKEKTALLNFRRECEQRKQNTTGSNALIGKKRTF